MNTVVTGATSFIGVPMIETLLERGRDVYAIVRPGSRNMGRLCALKQPGLHILELELGRLDRLHEYIAVPCQEFYHFAWDGAGSANRTNREVQQRNAESSLKALEGAGRLQCSRFLFSGSQAEYGVCQSAMTEETPCRPVSEYGRAKVDFASRAAGWTRQWRESGGSDLSCIHARIFSIYGPGDHPWSLVESCLRTFSQGEYLSLGECTQMWNFLYIRDLIDALFLLMEKAPAAEPYDCYNVAGPAAETRVLRDYVRMLYEFCGCHGSYSYGLRPQNAEGPANLIPDIAKLERTTGWKPRVSFQEGICMLQKGKNIDNREFL